MGTIFTSVAVRRLAAVLISFAVTTAIPYVLQDNPKLLWVWGKLGPVIVDVVE